MKISKMKHKQGIKKTEEWRLLLRNKILIIIIILLFTGTIFASEFLKIVPEVRSSGMGGVNNGISHGISSLYLNPAGLVNVRNYEFLFSHLMWPITGLGFTDNFFIQYEYFAYAKKIKKSGFGINLSHYHQPDYEFENVSYSIYSGFSSVTYAYDFYYFQAGIKAKIVWEVLGDYKGHAFGLDFGVIHSFDFMKLYKGSTPNFKIGLSIYNIGNSLVLYSEKEPLPANIQIGYSYTFFKNNINYLLFANDYKYYFGYNDMYKVIEINIGTEYTLLRMFSFRGGYILSAPVDDPEFADFRNNKFTCGVGAGYKISSVRLELNYSYITSLNIEEFSTHSMSLTFRKIRYIEKYVE